MVYSQQLSISISNSFLRKQQRLLKLEEQLARLHKKATDKEENKQVALGTAKLNYLDPRISIAWCVGLRLLCLGVTWYYDNA